MIYYVILMKGVCAMHVVLGYFKRRNTNMHVLIKHAVLMMRQHVALITLAAIRRVLREVYSFRLNCCRVLCREALHFVSEGTLLLGDVLLSDTDSPLPLPFSFSVLNC